MTAPEAAPIAMMTVLIDFKYIDMDQLKQNQERYDHTHFDRPFELEVMLSLDEAVAFVEGKAAVIQVPLLNESPPTDKRAVVSLLLLSLNKSTTCESWKASMVYVAVPGSSAATL